MTYRINPIFQNNITTAKHIDHKPISKNAMSMTMGKGPFGIIEMGGMFTVVKVRDQLQSYDQDPGWYDHPKGTVAYRLKKHPPKENQSSSG